MAGSVSAIWNCDPRDMARSLDKCLGESLEKFGRAKVFFRADDIAAPSQNFSRLMGLFRDNKTPLCLAVVPAWMSHTRWEALGKIAGDDASLWCWHQHGWRHRNHEATGKKQEFGPSRTREAVARDLALGRDRLESVLGNQFYPFFTPPWNRCGSHTLAVLEDMGYSGVSRSKGALPTSDTLPDLFVNVDLHTRREKDGGKDFQAFFHEFSQALETGCCGVMIHHQLMNETAFDFLEVLLQALGTEKKLDLIAFNAFE
ncbi:MAG: polysaccharide deacetylase family protein [Desulfatibacillum sp.]|nr:polysaccharide deacetylase family protein [Desulfatibacillum sp.]